MMTPNQLQEWINHLKPYEMDTPIKISHKIFPDEIDKMEALRIVKHLSPGGDDEFLLICKKRPIVINVDYDPKFKDVAEDAKEALMFSVNRALREIKDKGGKEGQ